MVVAFGGDGDRGIGRKLSAEVRDSIEVAIDGAACAPKDSLSE